MNADQELSPTERFDAAMPQVARLRNFLAGGKDHYECDRILGLKLLEIAPAAGHAVKAAREFHRRATEMLAKSGIRQFLDVATGFEPQVRSAACSVDPGARVIYVDRDPVVLAHGRAHEASADSDWIDADLRDVGKILECAAFDYRQPVAVSLVGAVEFVDDQSESVAAVRELLAALAPGSALVMCAATSDHDPDRFAAVRDTYSAARIAFRPRSMDEFRDHFAGLTLEDPGVVPPQRWQPRWLVSEKITDSDISSYAAVGRKS